MSAEVVDYGSVAILCGPEMKEYSRRSIGVRWCFTHRKREEFFDVFYDEVEPSYWGPTAAVEGPSPDCTDLFPGWTREWSDE